MAFKPKKKQPQFADLKGVLSQSKQTDNALYQTVQILIERLTQLQGNLNDDIAALSDKFEATEEAPIDPPLTSDDIVGLGYWTPLTDGDTEETDLIFANGECIAVFVPTP